MAQGTIQDQGVAPLAAAGAPSATKPRRLTRAWDDVPLRNKVVLLLVLASVGGALIDMLDSFWDHPGWILSIGLTLLVAGLLMLGRVWIGTPIEAMAEQLSRISREYDLPAIRALPIQRRDEVGQIARAIHQITSWSRQDYQEARHLRRTLDHRVAQATRTATRELRRMALRDPLTDLGNRRFLNEHLETLVDSVRQSESELVAVLIDADNFKRVNDTQGHAAGDELLVTLASILRASVRSEDYAVRMGGDEFLLLMPGCAVERATALSQRIISLFQQRVPSQGRASESTLSIGIASLRRDGARTGKELLELADKQLYAAKNGGKNRVAGG